MYLVKWKFVIDIITVYSLAEHDQELERKEP